MKLILRADVENLGNLGDIVTVRPGYGRNYLLPQGLAMAATEANQHAFELERKKLQARMDAQRAEARSMAEKIEALQIVIPMHVGENDKLCVDVDRRRILLDGPIRTLGEFEVRIRLHADVMANLLVKVVSDHPVVEEEAPAAEAAEAAPEAAAEQAE